MNAILAGLAVLIVYAGFRLLQDYVRRSMRSFQNAERVWPSLVETAEALLDRDIPPSVARLVVGLVSASGCGCFVRAMIAGHYLPRISLSDDDGRYGSKIFGQIEALDAETRSLFLELLAKVMVYDSFRNPFQGWLFRRAISEVASPDPSYKTKLEMQSAAYSVVAKRSSEFQPA